MNFPSEREITQEKRRIAYKPLLDQNYKFRTNCDSKDRDWNIRKCEEEGLEVALHPRAFWETGYEDPEMMAILTREKK